jgi:DNA anti-recombination protein RmuC
VDGFTQLGVAREAELVVAAVLVMPFARWAVSELWRGVKGKQRESTQAEKSLTSQITRLTEIMRAEFSEVRGLIHAQSLLNKEFEVELRHVRERQGAQQAEISSIHRVIEESRHTLRNEFHNLLLQLAGKKEGT